ncbi:thermonuclease family protein [Pseudorhodoplanes sinuspersici]|nr:thermonuclease family protein [Pseudorhodoplanes sinuspersici]RKE70432.1 endonuclease YncB(thermonuclease family) [Pseudorhodoplanes sinuspersici]
MGRWLTKSASLCANLGAILCAGFAIVLLTANGTAASEAGSACGSAALGKARVVAIPDSRTVGLDDGRLVKLAGIEWTVSPDTAKATLSELMLDQPISLKGTATPDRYGRIHAFPSVSGSETPVQYALLERGMAVMGGRPGDKACVDALLGRERAARAARLGLWNSGERQHSADAPNMVLRDRGQFAIVSGRVLSVRESGRLIYVNFGRRWSEDFTVTIAKRNEPTFTQGGLAPKSLSGRDVRVRGFVEERSGPWIEATRPEQFEVSAK